MDSYAPITLNRAATAIVKCRQRLEQARDEAQLALEILHRLREDGHHGREGSSELLLLSLEDVLAVLEAAAQSVGDLGKASLIARDPAIGRSDAESVLPGRASSSAHAVDGKGR